MDETDPILLKASLSFFIGLALIGGGFYIYLGTGSKSPFIPYMKYILLILRRMLGSKDFMGLSLIFLILIDFSL